MRIVAEAGVNDSFLDVAGITVGHAFDAGVLTGVTVIIPEAPVAMGVDVRGGGPGTRDTDALNPTCLVDKVHGLVLSGGSVFGLAAADAIINCLSADGVGLPLGPRAVPVVPSAILFDLVNGGNKDWGDTPPYARLAAEAYHSRSKDTDAEGAVGAGYGARAGGVRGGLASASLQTEDGMVVSALVAVNSFGVASETSVHEHGVIDLPKAGVLGANTTLAAISTNVNLDKAGCTRLAMMAQDGLARSIRPIHTPFDGDTVFAFSVGALEPPTALPFTLAVLGTLASDCLKKAVEKALKAANS